jgi:hypothetical protein
MSAGMVALAAAVLLVIAGVAGWMAPERGRAFVLGHPRRASIGVSLPLVAGAAMAVAAAVVRGRQGTCAQPRAIALGDESASLCEVVAPWLLGWAIALMLAGVVAGGLVLGVRLRASRHGTG